MVEPNRVDLSSLLALLEWRVIQIKIALGIHAKDPLDVLQHLQLLVGRRLLHAELSFVALRQSELWVIQDFRVEALVELLVQLILKLGGELGLRLGLRAVFSFGEEPGCGRPLFRLGVGCIVRSGKGA